MTDNGSMMCDAKGSGDWGRCSESALDVSKASVSEYREYAYCILTVTYIRGWTRRMAARLCRQQMSSKEGMSR